MRAAHAAPTAPAPACPQPSTQIGKCTQKQVFLRCPRARAAPEFAARAGWTLGAGAKLLQGSAESRWGHQLLPGSCCWPQPGLPSVGALRLSCWRDLGSGTLLAPMLCHGSAGSRGDAAPLPGLVSEMMGFNGGAVSDEGTEGTAASLEKAAAPW